MPAKIFESIEDAVTHLNIKHGSQRIVYTTSGGFDPLHVGHLRCIQETVRMAIEHQQQDLEASVLVVVIVNGDGFLLRKKGYKFMPHEERMEIIAGIEGVDVVAGWDDGTQTVVGALEILSPDFFTKGGDRSGAKQVPEFEVCKKNGCSVIFNVGGGKIQSSSSLVNQQAERTGIQKSDITSQYANTKENIQKQE